MGLLQLAENAQESGLETRGSVMIAQPGYSKPSGLSLRCMKALRCEEKDLVTQQICCWWSGMPDVAPCNFHAGVGPF